MDELIRNLGLLINATLIATPPLLYAALEKYIHRSAQKSETQQ